jgi:phosphocarrier protein
MQTRQVNVANTLGIHARLSAQIALLASRFKCSVSLAFNGRTANARNILAVMLLAASVGSTIMIEATGPDETEAIEALTVLIGNRSL